VAKNPGKLPVLLDLVYADGKTVEIDLGQGYRVASSISFLSELYKIVNPNDTTFAPDAAVYLEPPERKPWES
jgi:hypothetical protein